MDISPRWVVEYANTVGNCHVRDLQEVVADGIEISEEDIVVMNQLCTRLISITLTSAKLLVIPDLPDRLRFVDLSANSISDLSGVSSLRELRVLILCQNPIETLESLEPICSLISLQELELRGCPIATADGLVPYVQSLVRGLVALNGKDINPIRGDESDSDYSLGAPAHELAPEDSIWDSDVSGEASEDDFYDNYIPPKLWEMADNLDQEFASPNPKPRQAAGSTRKSPKVTVPAKRKRAKASPMKRVASKEKQADGVGPKTRGVPISEATGPSIPVKNTMTKSGRTVKAKKNLSL